jgi:hypothetical protein
VSTIIAIVVGLLLAGATVAGVTSSLNDHHNRPASATPTVKLYGSR